MQYIPGRFVYRATGEVSYSRVFLCVSSGTYFSGYWGEPCAEAVRRVPMTELSDEVFEPFTRIEESRDASTSDLH